MFVRATISIVLFIYKEAILQIVVVYSLHAICQTALLSGNVYLYCGNMKM